MRWLRLPRGAKQSVLEMVAAGGGSLIIEPDHDCPHELLQLLDEMVQQGVLEPADSEGSELRFRLRPGIPVDLRRDRL